MSILEVNILLINDKFFVYIYFFLIVLYFYFSITHKPHKLN